MAKRKPRNPLTGRTIGQEAYHLRRQGSKRNRLFRENARRSRGIGCLVPALLIVFVAIRLRI